jgi:serine/threonine protein kinase
MGTVYLAHDDALNRPLALKVLRSSPDAPARANASLAKRFLREAQAAAKLHHPHVVTIFTTGQHAGRPYIAMEFVEGGSLADHLRANGPLPWRDALAAARDALRALSAAHRAGIVHRDLKPANLLRARDHLTGHPLTKLTDFGLARANFSPADPDLSFPGAFVGSPSFASPEQITANPHLDGRADLYSLAATIYALLTGQPPFLADPDADPSEILDRHLHDPFPDVRHLAPSVPAQVQSLLTQASQKNPADRFPSAEKMLAVVEDLLALPADLPLSAAPSPAPVAQAPTLSRALESLANLETRLARARHESDSTTQLATLRSLYGLYSQLQRREEATRAYRHALALHIKLSDPHQN